MAHKNLGRKRRCASCGIKFYDLTKTPAVCPACGTEFDPEVLLKSRRGRAAAKVDEAKTPSKEEDVNDDDVVEKAENDEFENDDDEVLASESDLISISADDDEETGSSGVELIDVLDDDIDDAAGSDDE
ncbi:MAG: TIGR02300 family protein [SAR116 cluster bacterium]|nr:TIGR02300 family protein [SAR116 cluster bacterium]RPG93046.1 MAG: TIGR02300 family protein [Candidatus Puniceispirillum sp. TMED213]|tara:strand:- start:66 stop:452 length:387 start_codon:yes stop_codon:yes gene_type:complete